VLAVAALLAPIACAAPPAVDGARAQARVERQVAVGPRVPGSAAHAQVLEWLVTEATRLGGRVTRQAFTDSSLGRPLALTNVIASWGPGAGEPAGTPRIVLLAHWDSRPWADQDPDSTLRDRPVPGANDGASGVAVLLEAAEAMSHRAPAVRVDLVFVDGEDQGRPHEGDEFCLGARRYAAGFAPGAPRPARAFLFDMVGDKDLEIHPEVQASERAANLVALVQEAARATGARAFHPDPRYSIIDDHIPLLDAGIPAVDIIDFDYPAWHTTHDLPDQTSAGSLAQVARVAIWLIYRSPLARPPAR
jgi:glutaminyl-peptide cyclotransferase